MSFGSNMVADNGITINELKDRIRKLIDDRDWSKYHYLADIFIYITIPKILAS